MDTGFLPPTGIAGIEHGIVHRDPRAFCGWPFVNGFWETGAGDYLVAFQKKPADYTDRRAINHDEVALVGPQIMTIRSTDRGRTWDQSSLSLLYDLAADQGEAPRAQPADYAAEGPFDFTDPDVLVATGGTPDYFRPHSRAWIRLSRDGGRSWLRPILAEQHGLPSVTGGASPLVRPDGVHLLFMTVVTDDGWKRRPAGGLRRAAPPLPRDMPLWQGATLVALAVSLAFPMAGLTLVVVLALDQLVLSRVPGLRRVLS